MSQTITFTCPSCSAGLTVPANLAGVTGPCPTCGNSITAPQPQAEPEDELVPFDTPPPPAPAPPPEAPPSRSLRLPPHRLHLPSPASPLDTPSLPPLPVAEIPPQVELPPAAPPVSPPQETIPAAQPLPPAPAEIPAPAAQAAPPEPASRSPDRTPRPPRTGSRETGTILRTRAVSRHHSAFIRILSTACSASGTALPPSQPLPVATIPEARTPGESPAIGSPAKASAPPTKSAPRCRTDPAARRKPSATSCRACRPPGRRLPHPFLIRSSSALRAMISPTAGLPAASSNGFRSRHLNSKRENARKRPSQLLPHSPLLALGGAAWFVPASKAFILEKADNRPVSDRERRRSSLLQHGAIYRLPHTYRDDPFP